MTSPFSILNLPYKVVLPWTEGNIQPQLKQYCLDTFGPQTVNGEVQYYLFYLGAKFRNEAHAMLFSLRWIRG